jgi:anaerobic magnesium-protoporphyrin IX monomethyl ester cyclase
MDAHRQGLEKEVREMTDIVLIYPYSHGDIRGAMLFHPLGIALLDAVLKEKGMESACLDLTFQGQDAALAQIKLLKPKITGMYVMLTMINQALELAGKIREALPETLLVCGGPMPTVRPQQFTGHFDVVFRGEGALTFSRFCSDFLKAGRAGEINARHGLYPGFYAQDPSTGALVQTPPQPLHEEDINRLPLPDRRAFDHARYQHSWRSREGFMPAGIMTTYGCPHGCSFCSKPVFGSYFRRRDTERIMEEVRDIRSYGYDSLWIADDCFTLDPGHVRAFCKAMIRGSMDMRWSCLSRTGGISRSDVELMRQAGCRKVFFGLESGCNSVLKLMNKHATVEDAERTIGLFTSAGIEAAGFFMVGYPGETCETVEQTFAWALELPLSEISFTIPFPLPGTKLFEQVSGVQERADWRYENENRMIYNSEFDQAYLNRRIEETCALFAAKHRQAGERHAS